MPQEILERFITPQTQALIRTNQYLSNSLGLSSNPRAWVKAYIREGKAFILLSKVLKHEITAYYPYIPELIQALTQTQKNQLLTRMSSKGNLAMVRQLLTPGHEPPSKAIMLAAQHNHIDVVIALIQAGAATDIEELDDLAARSLAVVSVIPFNPDIFLLACRRGTIEVMQFFIDRGFRDPTNLPMLEAIRSRKIEAVELLLDHGYVLDDTVFIQACRVGNVEVMKLCLDQGIRVVGAMSDAVLSGSIQAVELLLDQDIAFDADTIITDAVHVNLEMVRIFLSRYRFHPQQLERALINADPIMAEV